MESSAALGDFTRVVAELVSCSPLLYGALICDSQSLAAQRERAAVARGGARFRGVHAPQRGERRMKEIEIEDDLLSEVPVQ